MERTIAPPTLELPKDLTGKYWFLYWIGGIYFKEGQFYARFFLIGVNEPMDHSRVFDHSNKIELEEPFRNIVFFPIGSIFDCKGKLLTRPSEYSFPKQHLYVGASDMFRATSRPFPFDVSQQTFPFPPREVLDGLHYFKHTATNFNKEKVHVIFPLYTLCRFLYFKSTKLTDLIVGYNLMDVIDEKSIEKYGSDKNSMMGYLKYDNLKLDRDEIRAIAPFIFFKGNTGLKALKWIGSSIMKGLIGDNASKPVYPTTHYPFSERTNLKVQGKKFQSDGKNYFFVYGVISVTSRVEDNLDVDGFYFDPMFPEASISKDRDGEETVTIFKNMPYNKNRNLKASTGRDRTNSFHKVATFGLQENGFLSFDVPTKFNDGSENETDIKIIPNFVRRDVKGLSSNLQNYSSEADMMRANFKQKYQIFDRYEYMRKISDILSLDNGIQTEYVAIDSRMTPRKTTYVVQGGESNQIMIVRLRVKNLYFYIIEFERNFTGLLADVQYTMIEDIRMKFLLEKIFEDFVSEHRYFWSELFKDEEFQNRFGIQVLRGVKHDREKKNDFIEVVEWGAKKIKKRIFKNIA